jgi:hypothetical protein
VTGSNRYDVTEWPLGDPCEDVGEVINGIIADIKRRQAVTVEAGRPGGVIVIPPGDYRLRTPVVIDISFLRIEGSGHGFTSSSIRFNVPEDEWPDLHELWPGGSRILVDIDGGAAFRVERTGDPRISSVEFADFCIDGLHFEPDGTSRHPENTYRNGKTGIHVASPNDSFRVTGMGMVYLERALVIESADALSVAGNFIAECGSCIELRGWGQASMVTGNLVGAGPDGHSIFAENHGGLLVATNNVFPRGASSVRLSRVTRSSVTANRLHSFYPGMVAVVDGSSENLIGSNHLLRDREPWTPFVDIDNGLDDLAGLVVIDGDRNSVIGNHISEVVGADAVRPSGAAPVIVRLAGGSDNQVSGNHIVAVDAGASTGESAYAAQVDALLTTSRSAPLAVTTVLVEPSSSRNVILDTGTDAQVSADRSRNAVRATPSASGRP